MARATTPENSLFLSSWPMPDTRAILASPPEARRLVTLQFGPLHQMS